MEGAGVGNEPAGDCRKQDEPSDSFGLLDEDSVPEDESDADYRARMLHVNTFLRLNDTISTLRSKNTNNPDYASEVQSILHASIVRDKTSGGDGNHGDQLGSCAAAQSDNGSLVHIRVHKHLIYHGDILQLSKETVVLPILRRDMILFKRIIDCSKQMIMGRYTDKDVANLRTDHSRLVTMWDVSDEDGGSSIGDEIRGVMRSILETPLYFTNSCMALIACGQMLRQLYSNTEGGPPETYEQLISFIRKHMRHNPADPFACNCDKDTNIASSDNACSEECKSLLSMIMELPQIVHHQTYMLQILAYLMYEKKAGREEVFINNLKNTCSPGLLDSMPTRLAMLMGTLDAAETRRRQRLIMKEMQDIIPFRERSLYNRNTLDKIVQVTHHPRVQSLIKLLPGALLANVELNLPKCGADKKNCLNKEFDDKQIMFPEFNNHGKKKCCGYLRQDPFDVLVSSISLAQLLLYTFTNPLSAPQTTRRHFFVRDIITAMARETVKIKLDTLESMYSYLDRTCVFKSVNEHPFMMATLQELVSAYIDYMKDVSEKYREGGRKRRVKRYMKLNGVPDGAV